MLEILTFIAAIPRLVTRDNALVAFDDLPVNDHIARKKEEPQERTFARSLRLAVKGQLVDEDGVQPGAYAIKDSDDVEVLGKEVDVIPLTYIDKAVDRSGEDVEMAFGKGNAAYQDIAKRCDDGGFDSGCMYGPVFLVFERTTGEFLEIFCNNKSMQREAKVLFNALPVTKAQAEKHGIDAKPPTPVLLGSKYLKDAKYPRQVPVWKASKATFDNPPSTEATIAAINNFLKQAEVEEEEHDR